MLSDQHGLLPVLLLELLELLRLTHDDAVALLGRARGVAGGAGPAHQVQTVFRPLLLQGGEVEVEVGGGGSVTLAQRAGPGRGGPGPGRGTYPDGNQVVDEELAGQAHEDAEGAFHAFGEGGRDHAVDQDVLGGWEPRNANTDCGVGT